MNKSALEEFTIKVEKIKTIVKEHYNSKGKNEDQFIYDGIINIEKYFTSKIKVLWLLKEPYSGSKDSMLKSLDVERALGLKKDSQSTWHPIIYTSYGILNEFKKFNDIPHISKDKHISEVLKQIAFININKKPRMSRTNMKILKDDFQENKELIYKQIRAFAPYIVIGANTLQLLKDDLEIPDGNKLPIGHFHKDNILYINALHPAQSTITREKYVDGIISRAKEYQEYFKK